MRDWRVRRKRGTPGTLEPPTRNPTKIAAALFAVGIAAGVVTLWLFGIEARVLIAFSFIAFGSFAEFESRTHRKREHLNRDLELQLASNKPSDRLR